jgi:GNAT superfamily N-acetyltransferase
MIRTATIEDRPHFLRLQARLLEDLRKGGSHILPTLPNLYRCLDAFECYVQGDRYGACLFWHPTDLRDPVGMIMAGADNVDDPWETDLGELCTLWGVYVDPEHQGKGIGNSLNEAIFQLALTWPADSFETYILATNSTVHHMMDGFDGKPFISRYTVSLREAKEFRGTK